MKKNTHTKLKSWKLVCYSSHHSDHVGTEINYVGTDVKNLFSHLETYKTRMYTSIKGTMIKIRGINRLNRNHCERWLIVE